MSTHIRISTNWDDKRLHVFICVYNYPEKLINFELQLDNWGELIQFIRYTILVNPEAAISVNKEQFNFGEIF